VSTTPENDPPVEASLGRQADAENDPSGEASLSYETYPEKDPGEYFSYVGLDGTEAVFDIARIRGHWLGRGEHDGEILYRTEDDRYALLFLYPDWEEPTPGLFDRELRSEDAARWLRANRHELAKSLTPIPISDPSEEPASRLHRNWTPEGVEPAQQAVSLGQFDEVTLASQGIAEPARQPPRDTTATGPSAGSKAIAAAYELYEAGEKVTVAAVARRARVDRSHLYEDPKVIKIIKSLASPDRTMRRGWKDRDGNIEAVDEEF
jgi:hypothetical protein